MYLSSKSGDARSFLICRDIVSLYVPDEYTAHPVQYLMNMYMRTHQVHTMKQFLCACSTRKPTSKLVAKLARFA